MDAGLSVELILWLKENPPHPFQNRYLLIWPILQYIHNGFT